MTHYKGKVVRTTAELVEALSALRPGVEKEITTGPPEKPIKLRIDLGVYEITVVRRDGGKLRTETLGGTLKVVSKADYERLKAAFPDSRVKVGTFYAAKDATLYAATMKGK